MLGVLSREFRFLRASRCPSHLLLLDHPLGDELVDRGLDERGGDSFLASIPLAVVRDGAAVVDDVPAELGERPVELRRRGQLYWVRRASTDVSAEIGRSLSLDTASRR